MAKEKLPVEYEPCHPRPPWVIDVFFFIALLYPFSPPKIKSKFQTGTIPSCCVMSKCKCKNYLRLLLMFIGCDEYPWQFLLFLPRKETCVYFWTRSALIFLLRLSRDDLLRLLCASDMRSALHRVPDLSLVPRDGRGVSAEPIRISAAQENV